MQKELLTQLLQDLEQEMLRLGYTEGSMKFYRRRWQMLLQFAQERGDTHYSEQMGIDFVEKHFHILEKLGEGGKGVFYNADCSNQRTLTILKEEYYGNAKTCHLF